MTIKHKYLSFICFSILFVGLLHTALLNGFWWDDIFYSLEVGTLRLAKESLFEQTLNGLISWMRSGRVFPVAIIQTQLSHFFGGGEREFTRALQVILVYLNILQVFWFLRRVTSSFYYPLLTAFLFIPLIQYRVSPGFNYVEPVSGLASMLQVCFAFSIASIHTAYVGIESSSQRISEKIIQKIKHPFLILSALFATLSLLTYEIGAVSFLIIGLMTLYKSRPFRPKQILMQNMYHIGFFSAYLLLIGILRTNASSINESVDLGELRYFWLGFRAQFVGTIPLSYALLLDVPKLLDPWGVLLLDPTFLISFVGIAVFLGMLSLFYKQEKLKFNQYDLGSIGIIAGGFYLVPCIFMGLSRFYQLNQSHGMAYLPVYFSYFGMAIALGLSFHFLKSLRGQKRRLFLTCSFILSISFVGAFHAYYNEKVFHYIEDLTAYERDAVFEGIKAGLMDGLNEESVVLSKIKLLYNIQPHFQALAATVLEHPPYFLFAESTHELPAHLYAGKTIYLLDGQIEKRKGGWLALIRLDMPESDKRSLQKVNLCEINGTSVRIMNFISANQKKQRIISFMSSFESKEEKVIVDSAFQTPKPIIGNWIRHIFSQNRLNSEYQIWTFEQKSIKPCSFQSEVIM